MKDHLVPKVGQHRLFDLFSSDTSLETKASTARWYAEMMIDLFFSAEGKKDRGEDNFNNLSLGEKIKVIAPYHSIELINSLNLIKQFGDSASHYKQGRTLNELDVKKIIEKSLSLFDFVLIDLMKNGGIRKTEITAKLFSTFLPSIRVRVLQAILDIKSVDARSDEDMFILDKLLLALVKNGEWKKAIRILEKLKKQKLLPDESVSFWKDKLQIIQEQINANALPIPDNIFDCKRNFEDVLSRMSEHDKSENCELIKISEILLTQIEPSEMGNKKPDLMIFM